MAIKPKFTQADINKAFAKVAERLHNDIIRRLSYIGEQLVTMSKKAMNIDPSAFPINYGDADYKSPLKQRELHGKEKPPTPVFGDYKDQSTNLRNSIGYVVVYNGQVVKGNYPQRAEGQALLRELSSKYSTGYALIVVAGMEYAVNVESKGYNVISSSEKAAGPLIEKMLRDLKINLK